MKVYVVVSSGYTSLRVHLVFSSREMAQKYIDWYTETHQDENFDYDLYIQEFELDGGVSAE